MKTATFKLNVHSVFFALLFTVVACQKEEFYEKDYLENPFTPDEVVDPSTSGGTAGGDTSGGTTGGDTTGGVTGDTTSGGTTGATTGVTTGGVTTGGTTTAGTTTGTTVGGSTTGTTDGGTTGTTTSGSTTGTTTGTTTGGTTTGTTTGGTTTGGTTGTLPDPQWMDETFTQVNTTQRKLDIVWVIDSSGSMADEQALLGTNFDLFINDFIDRGVDFKMGITTTDVAATSNGNGGRAVTNSQAQLTSAKAQADRTRFLSDFNSMVRVGIQGSGSEQGLKGSEMYVNRYKDTWMRADAYLIVVYVSDEEDQSPKTPAEYLAFLQASKSAAGYFKAYSIAGITGCPAGVNGYACGYARYAHVSDNSGGTTDDIHDSAFVNNLKKMGEQIITLVDSFPLAHDVIAGTMEVKFNGVTQSSGWSVDGRSLKIDTGRVPPVGTVVTVRYQY